MSTANVAAPMPRTSSLVRAVKVSMLAGSGQSRDQIIAKEWPDLGESQRALIASLGIGRPQAANEVQSTNYPASTAAGQLFTGIAAETLLGKQKVLAEVRLRSAYGAFAATEPTGVIHLPGEAVPSMDLDFSQPNLAPVVAAALVVISNELARDSEAENGIRDLLLRATRKAADTKFIALALNGANATASGADTAYQLRTQVREMVAALVAAGANTTMISLAASPNTFVLLATASDAFGNAAFPTVSLTAPSTLCGLPLLPTFGAADGVIVAIAGDAVLRAAGSVEIDVSTSAKLEFASDPTGKAKPGVTPVSASKQPVNLWQNNCRAVRVFYEFGADFVRSTRAAFIDGITLEGTTA
jgi:hypothetical protein